jgi:hypothetical protein
MGGAGGPVPDAVRLKGLRVVVGPAAQGQRRRDHMDMSSMDSDERGGAFPQLRGESRGKRRACRCPCPSDLLHAVWRKAPSAPGRPVGALRREWVLGRVLNGRRVAGPGRAAVASRRDCQHKCCISATLPSLRMAVGHIAFMLTGPRGRLVTAKGELPLRACGQRAPIAPPLLRSSGPSPGAIATGPRLGPGRQESAFRGPPW